MAVKDKQPNGKKKSLKAQKKTESTEKKPSVPSKDSVPSVIKKTSKLPKKLEKIIEEIEGLSVLELADLVKDLEEKFGVTAAPMAAPTAPAGAPAAGEPPTEAKPEQTTFNVILASAGANKISVIKTVREVNQNLGLKEAKDLVEGAPKEVLTGVNKETAEETKKKLEAAGAKVELR